MRDRIHVAVAVLVVAPSGAQAQDAATGPDRWKPELRPTFGLSVPLGPYRRAIDGDVQLGLQAAAEVEPTFHLVGAFAWTPAHAKRAGLDDAVHVLQYDAGVEFSRVRDVAPGWRLRPFAGMGAGARSFLYSAPALRDRTTLSGYGALGSELQSGNTALRAELRDNVFGYRAPSRGAPARTRSDLALTLGIAWHFR